MIVRKGSDYNQERREKIADYLLRLSKDWWCFIPDDGKVPLQFRGDKSAGT